MQKSEKRNGEMGRNYTVIFIISVDAFFRQEPPEYILHCLRDLCLKELINLLLSGTSI
jgi:hypothetical protein